MLQGNVSSTNSFAQAFCEDHGESLHQIGWSAGCADFHASKPESWSGHGVRGDHGRVSSERFTTPADPLPRNARFTDK
jgi:hypothetical protein